MAQTKAQKQKRQREQRAAAKADKEGTITKFELDGKTLEFNLEDLTFGEVEFVEVYFNCPLDEVSWESARGGMVAAFLALKRDDPDIVLDDLRGMKVNTLKEVDTKRPTSTATDGSGDQS
jgi:hypothetical protein